MALNTRSQLLPNIAVTLGILPSFIGLYGLLQPRSLIGMVNFPAPTNPKDGALVDAMTRIYAARNTVIGVLTAAVWYRGDRTLLGWTMCLIAFSPVVDALVSWDLIGGGMGNHLPIVPVLVGVGAGLLGWLG